MLDRSNGFFIHTHSLFKNMKGSRNNIKLTNYFFKSLCQFFSRTTNSIWIISSNYVIIMVEISSCSCSCTYLRFAWWCLSFCCSASKSWCVISFRCWFSLVYRWNSTSIAILTSFCSKVFNELLLIFIKIALPHHDNWVSSTGCEVVTTWWECSRGRWTFMAVKSIQDMTLS